MMKTHCIIDTILMAHHISIMGATTWNAGRHCVFAHSLDCTAVTGREQGKSE